MSTTCVLIAGLFAIPYLAHADPAVAVPATAPATAPADGSPSAGARLESARAALMAARAAAARDYQNRPEYQAAVRAVQATFADYNEKRNAVIDDVQKKDKRIEEMRGRAAAADSAIKDACQPGSTATQEQIEELYRQKETATRSWQTIEDDAVERAGLAPARKAWADASATLAGLTEREADEVEKTDAVKSAVSALRAAESEGGVLQRAAPEETDPIADYLRRYPRAGIGKALHDFDIPTAGTGPK
jgi:chromosome segregation ATPase